jgi:hypothetical protein
VWDEELGMDVPEGGFHVPDRTPPPPKSLKERAEGAAIDAATAAVKGLTRLIKKLPDPK